MLDIVAGEDGQLDGTADTVVGTEGGSLCRQPFTVDIGLDGVLVEVERHVYQFVAHHIHVALQDHRLAVLHTLGGSLADQHVARLVNFRLQSVALAPVLQIRNHLLLALRRAGNFVNLRKLFEDNSRF